MTGALVVGLVFALMLQGWTERATVLHGWSLFRTRILGKSNAAER
jgi:hypothetical protein